MCESIYIRVSHVGALPVRGVDVGLFMHAFQPLQNQNVGLHASVDMFEASACSRMLPRYNKRYFLRKRRRWARLQQARIRIGNKRCHKLGEAQMVIQLLGNI